MGPRRVLLTLGSVLLLVLTPSAALAHHPSPGPQVVRLATGLAGGGGSTIGPDGGLYVTESVPGRITRIDPRTGAATTFATGLPPRVVGGGGTMDVAFIGRTAYVLVTGVAPDFGGTSVDGIYRMDGPSTFTVIADIGAFAMAHPPTTDYFVPTGVQYAFEPYRDGFLVTDGHHNRVYQVGLDGTVTERIAFENVVPTGIAVRGRTVYMAEAGPLPHLPQDGKVVTFGPRSTAATEVASGGPLLVDVELDGSTVYALAQGVWPLGGEAGSPASPNTGLLLKVGRHGTFDVVAEGLNQPTSLELVRDTAYVVTLTGEVWTVDLGRHHH